MASERRDSQIVDRYVLGGPVQVLPERISWRKDESNPITLDISTTSYQKEKVPMVQDTERVRPRQGQEVADHDETRADEGSER